MNVMQERATTTKTDRHPQRLAAGRLRGHNGFQEAQIALGGATDVKVKHIGSSLLQNRINRLNCDWL